MSKQEVIICTDLRQNLEKAVTSHSFDKLFVLTDEHTREMCYPLIASFPCIQGAELFCIGVEDIHKNLETLAYVWTPLSTRGATRHSLLINLGGGMVTDLGCSDEVIVSSTPMILQIAMTLTIPTIPPAKTAVSTGISFPLICSICS